MSQVFSECESRLERFRSLFSPSKWVSDGPRRLGRGKEDNRATNYSADEYEPRKSKNGRLHRLAVLTEWKMKSNGRIHY